MPDFQVSKSITINAPPEKLYDIVAGVTRHTELAGSGEILSVRNLTSGPVRLGTTFEADEKVFMAGGRAWS